MDESTEFTCLHDIQHRDYDENVDNVELDSELAEQRKALEMSEWDTVAVNTSHSVEQPSNNVTQALNLTTSTSSSTNVSPY